MTSCLSFNWCEGKSKVTTRFRPSSLRVAAAFELEVVQSKVEDVPQGIQDQRVHVVFGDVLLVVVPHGEDAAHWKSHIGTELLHLSGRHTTGSGHH